MDPVLDISPPRVRVDPGGEARVTLTVRHPRGADASNLVTEYSLEVLGEGRRWTSFADGSTAPGPMTTLSFLDGEPEERRVEVVLRPPVEPGRAPEVVVGLRCQNKEQPTNCEVAEVTVAIGAIHDLEPGLVPVSPRGRWRGRYRVELRNTGTVTAHVEVEASDDKRRLGFGIAPRQVEVAPGTTSTAYVLIRPRQPQLTGRPVPHPFAVRCRESAQGRVTPLPAVFEQLPVVGSGVVKLVTTAVIGAVAVAAALLLLRPDDPGPTLPPPVVTVAPGEAGVATVSWDPVNDAADYEVGLLRSAGSPVLADSAKTGNPNRTTYQWSKLAPGTRCFRVRAINKQGTAGRWAAPGCADVSSPTPPDDGDLHGPYAIYGSFDPGDAGSGKAYQLAKTLRAAGTDATTRSTDELAALPDGRIVVYAAFPTVQAAQADCDKQKSAGIVTTCIVRQFP